MRVLVTGSEGFLGKHIVRALEARQHEVERLDLTLGHDITRPLPMGVPLDAVVHLAAIAAPLNCDQNPALAFDVNVNGTLQALKFALASGAQKFMFSSSAHVYGVGPRYLPTDESHALSLGNTYTTTKILGEQLCRLYWENHGLAYTALRLYNVYGPGQLPGFFIPDMLAKADAGAIFLRGANTTKDFVYVEDVADAFAKAVESPYVGEINIGTGVETPLRVVAASIAERKRAAFAFLDDERPSRMACDNSRARRILGWEPRVTLERGLDGVLDAIPAH